MTPQARRRIGIALALVVAWSAAALGHHSSAMYEPEKTLALRGVITQFRWTNPHVTMTLVTDDSASGGEGTAWVIETTSPGNLSRAGWTRGSIRVDDRIEVTVAPLRDGGHGGYCRGGITLLDRRQTLPC